jgi:tRNA-2-methylthio-N6-dimethylallyladenosine synthase
VVGVLGCMAERLKSKLLEEDKLVDIVVGPDSYRDLPKLFNEAQDGHRGINVLLSREETYAEITPVRLQSNGGLSLHFYHEGMQQHVLLLRGALYPGTGKKP